MNTDLLKQLLTEFQPDANSAQPPAVQKALAAKLGGWR